MLAQGQGELCRVCQGAGACRWRRVGFVGHGQQAVKNRVSQLVIFLWRSHRLCLPHGCKKTS